MHWRSVFGWVVMKFSVATYTTEFVHRELKKSWALVRRTEIPGPGKIMELLFHVKSKKKLDARFFSTLWLWRWSNLSNPLQKKILSVVTQHISHFWSVLWWAERPVVTQSKYRTFETKVVKQTWKVQKFCKCTWTGYSVQSNLRMKAKMLFVTGLEKFWVTALVLLLFSWLCVRLGNSRILWFQRTKKHLTFLGKQIFRVNLIWTFFAIVRCILGHERTFWSYCT